MKAPVRTAEVVEVIRVSATVGAGTLRDPVRIVEYWYEKNGAPIAFRDPFVDAAGPDDDHPMTRDEALARLRPVDRPGAEVFFGSHDGTWSCNGRYVHLLHNGLLTKWPVG